MLTFETAIPPLKINESVVSRYDKGKNYVHFTFKIRRFLFQEEAFEVYVSSDAKMVSIRYYYPEGIPSWAYGHFQSFVERLEQHIQHLPEYRLRFATKAMEIRLEGFPDLDEYDDFEEDIAEMGVFTLGIVLGLASFFEVFRMFDITVYGFLAFLTLISLLGFYLYITLVHDDKRDEVENNWFWRFAIPPISFGVIVGLSALGLLVTFVLSWLLPYPVTFLGFVLCFFGYRWVITTFQKLGQWNEKFTSKS